MKNFKWDKKYLYWGVTAFCVIAACIAFFWLLNRWSALMRLFSAVIGALSPFICGLIFAYLLNPLLVFFEKHVFMKLAHRLCPHSETAAGKLARVIAIIATELVAIGLVAGVLILLLPQLYDSISNLVDRSSKYFDVAVKWLDNSLSGNAALESTATSWLSSFSDKLMGWIESRVLPNMSKVVSGVTGGVITFARGVLSILIGGVIAIYIMYHKETFRAQGKKIIYAVFKPRTANKVLDEIGLINSAFGNYISGTLLDALIVGILTYIFMLIVGMPYAALISIIIAVTNIIPVFGPFIGAIPSALLLLLENPMQCLIFVIFILVLQQLDGNVIKPRIHGSKAGISGFWILFAILFFGALFGIIGMLLGVPIVTVLYDAIRRRNASRLQARGLPYETPEYKNIYRIDPETREPIYKVPPTEEEAEPSPDADENEREKAPASEDSEG